MQSVFDIKIGYSEHFADIMGKQFRGDCTVHLLCTAGEGGLTFNGKRYVLRKNDCVVISHTNLIEELEGNDDLQIEMVSAPLSFLRNQLPANNYGIGGSIQLFHEPVMHLEEEEACHLHQDMQHIRERMEEKGRHPFYMELMSGLLRTMMYDLFAFHARIYESTDNSERTSYVVKRFMRMLEAGECRTHRSMAYYADQLNVSPKYLSDTVKRLTGYSVTHLIDRHTLPIIISFLEDDRLTLNQISDEMNFSSLSYFTRYCTKHLGMTPSKYRNSSNTMKNI